jgi:hypothetical protein
MALSSPTSLSDAEKLAALRGLDQFREWHSLDDKRFCLVCAQIITGRQIHVPGSTHGNGPLQVSCPTKQCNSIPMDWVLPTAEILALVEMAESKDGNVAPSSITDHGVSAA